jgi:hypothetical protein
MPRRIRARSLCGPRYIPDPAIYGLAVYGLAVLDRYVRARRIRLAVYAFAVRGLAVYGPLSARYIRVRSKRAKPLYPGGPIGFVW